MRTRGDMTEFFKDGYNTVLKVNNGKKSIAIWNAMTRILNIFEIIDGYDGHLYNHVDSISVELTEIESTEYDFYSYSIEYVIAYIKKQGYEVVIDD